MLTVKRTILSASVVLVLAAGLTGCAATSSGSSLIPAAVEPAAAEITASATPAPTPKTGDVIDAAQADALKAARGPQVAYKMTDGSFVVVTKTEPLPAAVQAEVEAKTNVVAVKYNDVSADMNAASDGMLAAKSAVTRTTGKKVIVVWYVLGYPLSSSETKVNYWAVDGDAAAGEFFMTRAEAEASVAAWVAATPNSNEYAIIFAG